MKKKLIRTLTKKLHKPMSLWTKQIHNKNKRLEKRKAMLTKKMETLMLNQLMRTIHVNLSFLLVCLWILLVSVLHNVLLLPRMENVRSSTVSTVRMPTTLESIKRY